MFFKHFFCFLIRWSVTNSYHNDTLTGLSSDPKFASLIIPHPSGDLKRTELLLDLRATSIPSALPCQCFWKSFTVLQLHGLGTVFELFQQYCSSVTTYSSNSPCLFPRICAFFYQHLRRVSLHIVLSFLKSFMLLSTYALCFPADHLYFISLWFLISHCFLS